MMSTQDRTEMTVRCGDCVHILKVPDAGLIVDDNGRRVQIMHNGLRVIADGYYGPWTTEIISRLRGHHEPQEELVFHEVLKHVGPRATMVELGGFWSYYSLWFLQASPQRRAIVVEPDPNHLEVGRTNARLNSKVIDFVHASVGGASHRPRAFQTESAGAIQLCQVSIPDLLRDKGLSYLDILHSDIQGAELEVIESCKDLLLANRIGFCIVSTHAHQISGDALTHQKCLALLQELGGRILIEHDVHESFSGDGLIAAYFGKDPIDWSKPQISLNRYSTSLFRNPLYDLSDHLTHAAGVETILRREIAELQKQRAQQLRNQETLGHQVHRLLGESALLKAERDQHLKDIGALTDGLRVAQHEAAALRDDREQQLRDVTTLTAEVKDLREKAARSDVERERHLSDLRLLSAQVQEAQAVLATVEVDREQRLRAMLRLDSDIRALSAEREQHLKDIEWLTAELRSAQAGAEDLKADRAQQLRNVESLTAELTQLRDETALLRRHRAQHLQDAAALTASLAELQQSVGLLQGERRQHLQDLHLLASQLKQAQAALSVCETDRQQRLLDVLTLTDEIKKLQGADTGRNKDA